MADITKHFARLDPSKAIYRFLDTNGNGTGTKNANGDYSSVADEFYFQPTNDTEINRLVIHITDTSGILQNEYGNLGSALTNGYTIKVQDSTPADVLDLCDGTTIKTNADIGRYCYDVDLKSWGTTPTNETLQARWTFSRAGYPLLIPAGYRLSITLNDSFTGLIEHYFMIQGYELPAGSD